MPQQKDTTNIMDEPRNEIEFAQRSKFLQPCQEAIFRQSQALNQGQQISIDLSTEKSGYAGKTKVAIEDNGSNFFSSTWVGEDRTRFPARIRAAATALKTCRSFGDFEIQHRDGILTIRRLDV